MKVCSLFAGVGGIDIAFARAGFSIAWANEYDHDACETYRLNHPSTTLAEGDIREIDAAAIPDFDVLAAGFPCQPFSVCGKQQGFNDSRGNLFFEILRVLDAKQPPVVFLENVANLVEHDSGRTFQRIYNELAARQYYIKYLLADACDYGVPQHRTRIYIIAFKDYACCSAFVKPQPRTLEQTVFDLINRHIKAPEELYYHPETKKYRKLASAITDDSQIYRFSDYGIQKSKDGVSFTLKANMGTWYDREPIIKDDFGIRRLSPKECFLLQGFPDSFSVRGIPVKSAYKQAGNTVCVPVVQEIATAIAAALGSTTPAPERVSVGDVLWWVDRKRKTEGTVTVTEVGDKSFSVNYNGQIVTRDLRSIGRTLYKQSQLVGAAHFCAPAVQYAAQPVPF